MSVGQEGGLLVGGKDDGLAQRCRVMAKGGAQSQPARVQIPALPPFTCKLFNLSLCQLSYLRMIVPVVLPSWRSSEELVSSPVQPGAWGVLRVYCG